MHLSFASSWVDPRDTPGESSGTQGEWYSFGISFFPSGEGSCLVLETPSLDHEGIPMEFLRGSETGKVKSALPCTMVDVWKWEKSVQKKSIDLFVTFANEK